MISSALAGAGVRNAVYGDYGPGGSVPDCRLRACRCVVRRDSAGTGSGYQRRARATACANASPPDELRGHLRLRKGGDRTDRGDYEAAIAALERLLYYNSNLAHVKYELGTLYFKLRSFDMAKRYFKEALVTPGLDPVTRSRIEGYLPEARALIKMWDTEPFQAEQLTDTWRRLANSLMSPNYRAAMSRLTGRDLSNASMEAYVCHYGPGAWLGPHLDLKDKIVTHVLYFNQTWNQADGGCLNILNSAEMNDIVATVRPIVGNSSVLVRSDNSWHAVSKVAVGCRLSRRSMNVIFYHPGAVSTMWPPGDNTPLHTYTLRDVS
jgi:hypothetical protein